MDKMKFAVLFVAVLAPAVAWANSVIVEGTTYTCTNTCDVTFSNGTYTVRDCCGGRVRFVIQPA